MDDTNLANALALLREVRLIIRQPLAMRLRNDVGNRIDQFLVALPSAKPGDDNG